MTQFTVTSGKIICTDPCYNFEYREGLQMLVENCKLGEWRTRVVTSNEGAWGNRVAELVVTHESADSVNLSRYYDWVEVADGCGVDSGQFGFFDAEKYPTDESEFEHDGSGCFYDTICGQTIGDRVGAVSFGVASSSGYGDGSYPVYVAKNGNGEVVALKVVFISDEDYEDEDDYDTEEDIDE